MYVRYKSHSIISVKTLQLRDFLVGLLPSCIGIWHKKMPSQATTGPTDERFRPGPSFIQS